jgi:hypothetical protein
MAQTAIPENTIPTGVHFAPVTPELLAAPGVTLAHVRVWSHVWLQTLGRPEWTLSHRQIATATGASVPSVKRALRVLAEAGWLTITHRRDAAGDAAPSLILCTFPEGVGSGMNPPPVRDEPTGGVRDELHQKSHLPVEETHTAPAVADSPPPPADDADADEWAEYLQVVDPEAWDTAWSLVAAALTPDDADAYLTNESAWHTLHARLGADALTAYDNAATIAA